MKGLCCRRIMSGQLAMPSLSLIVVFLIATGIQLDSQSDERCHVFVHEPWPIPRLFVPRESTVEINCTAQERSYTPLWLINLGSDTKDSPILFINGQEQLNSHGVYELPQIETPGMPPTVRLVINDTARNNQTVIECDQSATASSTTTLFVLDKALPAIPLTMDTADMSVKLSWSRESQSLANAALQLSLRVSSESNSQEIPWLNKTSYFFTAPEDALPCEVYNFSVTATYVGATYTGAGCSVPSPVLSTMLPSLPNISQLESSVDYALTKQSTGITLCISFEPASYCEDYSVINYTLEVNGTRNEVIRVSVFAPSAENFSIDGNLSENAVYSFRIHVSNTVGVVSTRSRQFYTTDVQLVTATLIEGVNTSIIQCEFIGDSNAAGCRVVLTNTIGQEVYYDIRKNQSTNLTATTVTLEHPPSCYSEVKAFDIESDSSRGTLAIPGHIMNLSQAPSCTIATLPGSCVKITEEVGQLFVAFFPSQTQSIKKCVGSLDDSNHTSAVVVTILSTVIIVIVVVCKSKKVRVYIKALCKCSPLYSTDNDGDRTHYYEQINLSPANEVCGVSTDGIDTTPNEVYGVSTDGIETTPNEVYGVSTDGIETTPNMVYGVSTDAIETTPNMVYGVSTDAIETTPNMVYGVSTDGIEINTH